MAKRIKSGIPAVDKATLKELRDFVGSWEGKLSIPPAWIQKNLTAARKILRGK